MKFNGTLFDYQTEAVGQLAKAPYCILAHDMGLGKSVTSLARACAINKSTLIICPSYLRKKWQCEDVETFVTLEDGDEIRIMSYSEMVKEGTSLKRYNTIIVDEAQYVKNLKAKRTIALHQYIIKNNPEALFLLSGTPIKNRVPEIFSLLQLCFYGDTYPAFKPFYRLFDKFCNAFAHEKRYKVNGHWISQFEGLKNVELLRKIIKPIYFRKRSADVIDLPKQNYNDVVIKGKSDYDIRLAKAYELFEIDQNNSSFMTLKAANALAKTPATIELARNIAENGEQVVIFTDHIASCQEIARQLDVVALDGTMPVELRDTHVDRFKKGLTKYLVITIGAGSTGHNLTCANYMIFNDLSFVPTNLEQAEKRIHRIGQTKPCFYYYMFSSPVDKRIYKQVKSKMLVINEVNGEQDANATESQGYVLQ